MIGRLGFFLCARFASFPTHASLLTFFDCFFILFHSCSTHAQVFVKILVHEFPISCRHTEWYSHPTYALWNIRLCYNSIILNGMEALLVYSFAMRSCTQLSCCSHTWVFGKTLLHEFPFPIAILNGSSSFLSLVPKNINMPIGHYYRLCSWSGR